MPFYPHIKTSNTVSTLISKRQTMVLLDKIADKKGETLNQERQALEAEKVQIDNTISSFGSVLHILEKVRTLSSELDSMRASLSQTLSKLEDTQVELNQLEEMQERNRKRLVEAQSAGAIKRFLAGLHPDKIQHEIDQVGELAHRPVFD